MANRIIIYSQPIIRSYAVLNQLGAMARYLSTSRAHQAGADTQVVRVPRQAGCAQIDVSSNHYSARLSLPGSHTDTMRTSRNAEALAEMKNFSFTVCKTSFEI